MSKTKLISEIAGAWDWDYDPWGTALALFFDVASVLDMSDVAGDLTAEPFKRWGYNPAPLTRVPSLTAVAARAADFNEGEWADDFDYSTVSLAAALVSGQITQEDLIHVGNVLNRYTALVKRAGRAY